MAAPPSPPAEAPLYHCQNRGFLSLDTGHKGLMPCVMSRVKISRLHSFLHAKPSFTTQAYPAQNSKAARISISRSGSQTSSISSNRW